MTTVAFDGKTMAADALATDAWGLKFHVQKIWVGENVIIGGAGESGAIQKWLKTLPGNVTMEHLHKVGYSDFDKDSNDPHLLVVPRGFTNPRVYRQMTGMFADVSRPYFAIGSGRDYALMAMRLGKTAGEAVLLAAEFDNGTNDVIQEAHV